MKLTRNILRAIRGLFRKKPTPPDLPADEYYAIPTNEGPEYRFTAKGLMSQAEQHGIKLTEVITGPEGVTVTATMPTDPVTEFYPFARLDAKSRNFMRSPEFFEKHRKQIREKLAIRLFLTGRWSNQQRREGEPKGGGERLLE